MRIDRSQEKLINYPMILTEVAREAIEKNKFTLFLMNNAVHRIPLKIFSFCFFKQQKLIAIPHIPIIY